MRKNALLQLKLVPGYWTLTVAILQMIWRLIPIVKQRQRYQTMTRLSIYATGSTLISKLHVNKKVHSSVNFLSGAPGLRGFFIRNSGIPDRVVWELRGKRVKTKPQRP
jgi:hypothetical protein